MKAKIDYKTRSGALLYGYRKNSKGGVKTSLLDLLTIFGYFTLLDYSESLEIAQRALEDKLLLN